VFGPEATPALMDELCAFYQEHHASMAALHGGVDGMLQFLKSRGVRLGSSRGRAPGRPASRSRASASRPTSIAW